MSRLNLERQIKALPQKTGVYIMKADEVLYVGKASNIRNRVKNHLQAVKSNPREAMIIAETKSIEYIITSTCVEALIEENILIKQYRPKYNIRLSDDKTYPYLKLSLDDEYPTLSIVRRTKNDKSRYFGPYADVAAMRQTLKTLRKLFPLTACKFDPRKPRKRPCIYYQIGLCSGICAGLISKKEYNERVKELLFVMEGRPELAIEKLKSKMLMASTNLEYEKAAKIRDQIGVLEKTLLKLTIVFSKPISLDVLGVANTKTEACVQVMQVKNGKLVSSESFDMNAQDVEDSEIIESFMQQYYSKRILSPPEIIVSAKPCEAPIIQEWMLKKFNSKTKILSEVRGQKRRLLELAIENARSHLDELADKKKKLLKGLEELQNILDLDTLPKLIECFDISTLRGKSSVGSMISFLNGEPLKRRYRRFKIKTIVGQDDPKMISEIIHRRYKRLLQEKSQLPDLIIVDGGMAQLNAARKSTLELGIELPIIGLAKQFEHVYSLNSNRPISLPKNSEGLYLLQRIRDEAHRFAIAYHRKLRSRTIIKI
ncbi:excinuclease ABC subunit UvrC [[Eubacterium] cellulosolvens]